MEINLGRVAFLDRGVYGALTSYNKWDFVTKDGSTYLYINIEPSIGVAVTDVAYWKPLAIGGDVAVAIEAAQAAQQASETAQGITEAAEAQTLLYRDAAAAIVSGGPKGVYATLAALISANPDHAYTYVSIDDGNWNYWNGTTFVAGGAYQTALGVEQTVTASLTNVPCGNAVRIEIVDLEGSYADYTEIAGTNEATTGIYNIQPGNYGEFQHYDGWLSKKIEVKKGANIYITASVFGSGSALAVYFDANGDYISYEFGGDDSAPILYSKQILTVPANAVAIGLTNRSVTDYSLSEYKTLFNFNVITPIKQRLDIVEAESSANETAIVGILDKSKSYLLQSGTNESEAGYYDTSTHLFSPYSGFKSKKITIISNKAYYATAVILGSATALAIYFDINGTYISMQGQGNESTPDIYNRYLLTIPINATEVAMTNYSAIEYSLLESLEFDPLSASFGKNWINKKIAYYGTSIPAGYPHEDNKAVYSYANKAALLLGSSIQNYCIPGGYIRNGNHLGVPISTPLLCFANLLGTANYKNQMVDLIGTENEPDLFVFDYGVNDGEHDIVDINNIAGYDFTSESTDLFLGSFNFVLKQLFTAKPRARVLLVTHYSDDGVQNGTFGSKNCWKTLNDLIILIGEYWNIPVLKMRDLTSWHNTNGIENISTFCPDLIHPATDLTLESVNILTQLLYKQLDSLA